MLTHAPPQLMKPGSQATPQLPLEQIADPLLGFGQTLPHAPQFSTSVEVGTQTPPQALNPELQLMPHVPELQLAAPS